MSRQVDTTTNNTKYDIVAFFDPRTRRVFTWGAIGPPTRNHRRCPKP
jgi:hypothetical protein